MGTGLLLGGCGRHEPEPASVAAATAAARKPLTPAETLSRSLVAAVPAARPAGPLAAQLKFGLQSRPELNQPLEVKLAILPGNLPIERVYGKVQAEEGLELQGSAELPETVKPAEGQPIVHSVYVVPRRDGLFILTATVTVEAAGQTNSQTYSIPIIAGEGMPEGPARVPAAASPAPAR
ncbi:MAG: hypothetical protein JO341_09315 [Gammaproteobacteria bacterium]|nr:hypothetical protein [Gammaproteobacteria bacterium]